MMHNFVLKKISFETYVRLDIWKGWFGFLFRFGTGHFNALENGQPKLTWILIGWKMHNHNQTSWVWVITKPLGFVSARGH